MILCIIEMKVRLYLSTIAILLLFKTAFALAGTSSLKSKQSALRNLAFYTKENGQTTCSGDIEEILYFLKLGDEHIERTDVSDVVIVLGTSGVGKSTLTQFVANETNTLRVVCGEWGACSVVDDTDTIGNDLISRTFLPNLVFHESTQTPFYDMPGFNDNRNESMEIANSFFMQQIIEDAKSVKILVLARYNSFEISAKLDFKYLLRNLVDLIKSPTKFRGGMAIISTMAPLDTEPINIIGLNTQFLKVPLLGNITELFQGEDKYIRGSTEIIENWLDSDTGNYFDAKYYSYFFKATKPGPLLEDAKLFHNKKILKELIWDRLEFVPKESGDFGLPMSGDAKLKLVEVGLCITNTLTTKMDEFADDLEAYIRTNVSNFIDGKETDFVHIAELFLNLTTADLSFNNMEGEPLSAHLQKLLSEINSLQIPSLHEIRQEIEDTLTFIQFIELANVEIQFDPKQWVSQMMQIKGNLNIFLGNSGFAISTSLAGNMKKFADDLDNYIRTNVANFIDGTETDLVHIAELFMNLTTADFSFDNMDGRPLSAHLQLLLSEVNNLEIPSLGETRQEIEETLTFILFIELTNVEILFDPKQWVSEMKPIKGDLTIFLGDSGFTISTKLATKMTKFAEDLEVYVRVNVSDLIDGKETDFVQISELLTNFTSSDFTFANMVGHPLSTYLQKLLSEVNNIKIPSLDETLQQIEVTLTFIQFIESANVKVQFDPKQWVIEMNEIKGNLISYFDSQAKELLDATISWFADDAIGIAELILTKIDSLNDISDKEILASSEVEKVKNMFEKINSVKPTKKLIEFLGFYLIELDILRGFQSGSSIPHLNALSVLQLIDDFSWSSKDWTSPTTSTLQEPLENERDLSIFLRALFKDLSLPITQTGDDLEIHTWWRSQQELNEDNFEDFYKNIIIQGFTAPSLIDKSRLQKIVFKTTRGTMRLEFLLNFMLTNVYNCPNSSQIIVTGPIISLDRIVSRCINQQQTTTSIVLLATHKMYANAKVIGREINPSNNINVILMSPELIVSNHSEIDLSGNVGQQGVQGKPAGTQYSLFQSILSANDGSISARITFPNVTGGPGVDGAVGSSGYDSTQTGTNNFNVDNNCVTWLGGWVQISDYINTCNTLYCGTCYCYASSEGVLMDIFGSIGPRGGTGGNGKDGSCGGAGGQSYFVDANAFLSAKTATNGLQGINGVGGAGGPGGLGGFYGHTLRVRIENIYYAFYGRYCVEFDRKTNPSTERGPSGYLGSNGKSCTHEEPRKSVNRTSVTNHFTFFKGVLVGLATNATNEFLFSKATSLLNLLGSGQPLG